MNNKVTVNYSPTQSETEAATGSRLPSLITVRTSFYKSGRQRCYLNALQTFLLDLVELHTTELSLSSSSENCLSTMPQSDALLKRSKEYPGTLLLYYIVAEPSLEGRSHPHTEIALDVLQTPSLIRLTLRANILTEFSVRITFSYLTNIVYSGM